jgi:1-acyl-sn-glycerol-3-phosphate acyltransferase
MIRLIDIRLFLYRAIVLVSALVVIIFTAPGLIVALWWTGIRDCPPGYWTYWWLSWAYQGLVAAGWVPIRIQGDISSLQRPAGVVIIANHQSSADIPLVGSLLGVRPHVWLYWRRFMYHKYIGFFVRHIGLPVLSSQPAEDARTLIKAVKLIKCGYAVVLFPEGGRYVGHTNQFLGGFELIARKAQCPIIPVHLKGVEYVLPPGKWWGMPQPIDIVIGDGIMPSADVSSQELIQQLHAWFVAHD